MRSSNTILLLRFLFVFTGLVAIFAATHASAAPCVATDTASLVAAIEGTSCATVTLGNSITLNGDLPAINRDLTIDGGGFTIDGDGAFQALHVTAGNVAINDLTVNDARAQGGTGGGAGLGGGLFVGTGAAVIIDNVTLSNNEAVGGVGASGGTGGSGSGGGLYVQSGATVTANGVLGITGNKALGGTGGSGGNGGQGDGGGIDVQSGGSFTSNAALTLLGNQALGGAGNLIGGNAFGGGVYNQSGNNLIATNILTIQGNIAIGGTGNLISGNASGGGVFNDGNLIMSPVVGLTQTIADEIAGNGSLTKAGLGNLISSAANTYSGTTTVNDGNLIASGNNALGGGIVTVNAAGALDLNTTKQIIPGLDLGGALGTTLAGTSAGQYGKVNVTGTATVAGELDLSLADGFKPAVGDMFDIMGFNVLSGNFTGVALDGLGCGWTPSASGGIANCGGGLAFLLSDIPGSAADDFYQLEVTSAVPEPGTLALMASAFFMLFLTRRTLRAGQNLMGSKD